MAKRNTENTELRDKAALAALSGLIAGGSANVDATATSALEYADALVKAVEAADKPEEPPPPPVVEAKPEPARPRA